MMTTVHTANENVTTGEPWWMSVEQLRRAYIARELSPVEVASAHLERITALDPVLNSYVTVTAERALDDAREAEAVFRTDPSTAPPLAGVPYAIKDLVPTKGIRTARGSAADANWIPETNSPLAERLRGAGGSLLGKTTTSELGWKADAGNPVNGPARNPFNPELTAGGSSGGAAAAVAAGLATVAQGGDGAGSVRIPAAFCGVVGFKPGVGVIPYYPPTPLSTIVANGTFGRSVRDAAILLDAMSGPDLRDPLSMLRTGGGYRRACDAHPDRPLRIAYCPRWGGRASEPHVHEVVEQVAQRLARAGHAVELVETTPADRFDLLHVIWTTGFGALLPKSLEEVDPGLAAVVREAAGFTGADLAEAHLERQIYKADVATFLDDYDLLLTPTVAVAPFVAGQDAPTHVNGVEANYLDWAWFTYAFNLTENPAVSLPAGNTRDGLPVGIQLVGKHADELGLLTSAAAIESHLG